MVEPAVAGEQAVGAGAEQGQARVPVEQPVLPAQTEPAWAARRAPVLVLLPELQIRPTVAAHLAMVYRVGAIQAQAAPAPMVVAAA